MVGLGTVINTAAILAGGVCGALFGRVLSQSAQDTLMKVCGVGTLFIAISGAMEGMLTVQDGKVVSSGALLIIGCLAIGAVIGEALNIEGAFERLGQWLKIKTGNAKDKTFVNAFVSASLTVCIGAMAIVGSIQDGMTGDWTTLAIKGAIDALLVCTMTASMGKGCIFAAIPVLALQGALTLLASFLQPLMTAAALANLSTVGSILIFCIGINLIWPKTFRVANMLPAVVVAMAAAFVM